MKLGGGRDGSLLVKATVDIPAAAVLVVSISIGETFVALIVVVVAGGRSRWCSFVVFLPVNLLLGAGRVGPVESIVDGSRRHVVALQVELKNVMIEVRILS